MSKHTLGPWLQLSDGYIYGQDSKMIALPLHPSHPLPIVEQFRVSVEEANANARLIAAAPDLLEAIKDAVENCETCRGNEYVGTDCCCRCQTFAKLIAKAEGR